VVLHFELRHLKGSFSDTGNVSVAKATKKHHYSPAKHHPSLLSIPEVMLRGSTTRTFAALS
jgi:hypothetical protein